MNRNDHLEQRLATKEVEASTMTLILPTDIMLGRGPTCYNNPGNKVFRKLIKEHVAHYKTDARRKEKAALVKLLVSKMEAKGYRFLHRSTAGTWVEAPPHIVKNKVGHGLRDARIEACKIDGNVNVSPKKSHPNSKEPKLTFQVVPVITVQAKATEGMQGEESCNMVMITTGDDLGYVAFRSSSPSHLVQESPIPEKGQQLIDPKALSNLNKSSCSDLMTHEPIPEKRQQLLDPNAPSNLYKDFASDWMPHSSIQEKGQQLLDVMSPSNLNKALDSGVMPHEPIPKKGQQLLDARTPSNLNKALDSDSMPREPIPDKEQQLIDAKESSNLFKDFSSDFMPLEFLHSDGLWEDTAMPLFDNESDDCPDHCGSGDHVNKIADQIPHESSTASEMEQGIEDGEQSWDDKNDTTVLPGVSPHDAAHIMDTLDVALTIYAAVYKGTMSLEDCLAGDPLEPLKYEVDDSQSLCRWLSQSA